MLGISSYLALKEIQRNRGRFLLVAMVIALITLLVLFIAGLGEGLGSGNRQYVSKLDAQLLVFLEKSDYLIGASRLNRNVLNQVLRVDGVADAGPVATANSAVLLPDGKVLKVAMLGVEPGKPGEPRVVEGRPLGTDLAREVLIDRNVVVRTNLKVGDFITIRSTQGTRDQLYTLEIVGVTEGQSYSLQPALILPYFTWDRVRPKSEAEVQRASYAVNIIAVQLADPSNLEAMRTQLAAQVPGIEVADLNTAIQSLPGYSAQQSTLQTQGVFTLLIGVLVIGGGIGGALTFLLALGFPPTVPIVFNGTTTAIALAALLLIGPLGGIVSVRYAVRIEPLKALRLS